jgi:transposase-like protein
MLGSDHGKSLEALRLRSENGCFGTLERIFWREKRVLRWDAGPFFTFAPDVRKILYTTNAIESLHSQVGKAVRNKGLFTSDQAATKLIFLAIGNITAKWKRPPKKWHAAKAQLAIQLGSRFERDTPTVTP